MAKKNETGLAVVDEKALAELGELYPTDPGGTRILLPRLGFVSQDITEEVKNPRTGKKEIKIITEAGTFYIERPSEEEKNEDGTPKWERTEIGTEIEAVILYQRKQLKYYDGKTELFTSSPVYDTDDEVVPLFCNKSETHRGTPAELKALEEFQKTEDGKTKSKLEDTKILYVLYEGDVYQLNLRGSSMFSFKNYGRKTLVPAVLTVMNSEVREKGSNVWSMITFTAKRKLVGKELNEVVEKVRDIKETIAAEKSQFGQSTAAVSRESAEYREAKEKADKDFE